MNISILWGGESQAYVRQSRPLDTFICLLKIREPIVMISLLSFLVFQLELEKQIGASVIIKPLLSLKKPVCLGRLFLLRSFLCRQTGNYLIKFVTGLATNPCYMLYCLKYVRN